MGSKTPPQNSGKAKKLGGGRAAHKSPIGSTNNQWGMKKTPLIKVSLYLSKVYNQVINSLRFLKGVFLFKQVTLMRYVEGLLHIG